MCKKCVTAAPIALAPDSVNLRVKPSTVMMSTAVILKAEKPAVGTTLFSDMSNFEFVKMLRNAPDLKGDAIAEAADRIEHLIAMNRNLGP